MSFFCQSPADAAVGALRTTLVDTPAKRVLSDSLVHVGLIRLSVDQAGHIFSSVCTRPFRESGQERRECVRTLCEQIQYLHARRWTVHSFDASELVVCGDTVGVLASAARMIEFSAPSSFVLTSPPSVGGYADPVLRKISRLPARVPTQAVYGAVARLVTGARTDADLSRRCAQLSQTRDGLFLRGCLREPLADRVMLYV